MSSRTYNPLHFEDLEPKRFEDLVRQLAYDFRDWAEIEATGRSGNDAGFDVRAWEKVSVSEDDDESKQERKWLIQCKREKSIGPTKAEQYANDILVENSDLYGVLFVASCDLSKDARDAFRKVLADAEVQEVRIWSRAELEDQLFQPKNDNLLFAYFGFSLARRKQTEKTKIKSKLVTKRKVQKIFGDRPRHRHVLIRDVEHKTYPQFDDKDYKDRDKPVVDMSVMGYFYGGLLVSDNRYMAYVDHDKKEYDIESRYNQIHINRHDSRFYKAAPDAPKNRWPLFDFFNEIPEEKRHYYMHIYAIFYENIVDIDEQGDEFSSDPHIYVNRMPNGHMYARPTLPHLDPYSSYHGPRQFDEAKYKRIKFFPKVYKNKKVAPASDPAKGPRKYVEPSESDSEED